MTAEVKDVRNINDPDQRYFPRWEVENRVLYRLEGKNEVSEGTTQDLSCTGACLTLPGPVTSDKDLKLTIYLNKSKSFDVVGKVIWAHEDVQTGQTKIGVTFSDLTTKDQELILNHAFELKKDQVYNQWFKGWAKES